MFYTVKGMQLIPQTMSMSCWYASARMLINWRQEMAQASIDGLIPPELDERCRNLRTANNGINNRRIISMAERLGLRTIPPMTPTPELLLDWLQRFGPLWVNGKNHIVVISGIMKTPFSGHKLLVYDPSPRNAGKIEWRDMNDWYLNGSSISTRDTHSSVQTVFLHCPAD